MKQFTSKPLLVRYGETDQMGVVHHSNYLRYFEVARLEWLSALGVSYASMEKEGLIMPVIDIKATYKTPALFDDSLTIYVFLSELPRVKIIFLYEIKNQKDEIVCTGETTLAFLNAKTRKLVRCPEEFGALFIT
ncbi:MAG: acyl-CoA thioester hydrolase [Candidatus Arcticimaribacter sp.]|jgi:acyl-CoA thioester hydrolase